MTFQIFLAETLAFGLCGMLIECLFTGVWSAIHGDRKLTCQTYLWMFPVYGSAGLLLTWIHGHIFWPLILMGLLYTVLMYLFEFSWGFFFRHVLGVCPWDYGRGKWTVLGLVQLKYVGFWFGLAMAFNPVCDYMHKVLYLVAKYG